MSDRIVEIKLPKLGESIVSATVVKWLKEEGDQVSQDEPILEVSTDKVNSEIPAPQAGVLTEILVEENQEIDVGAPLAKLLIEKTTTSEDAPMQARKTVANNQEEKKDFLSPAVLQMARREGVSLDALTQIKGTGSGGRITKKDVESYLKGDEQPSTCPLANDSSIEKLPMSGLRKAIAANMVKSFYEAPHASLVTEADVTDVMAYIKTQKEDFKSKYGVKLTITSYIVQAITEAIKNYPMVNASVEKDTILMKRFVNMGVAVSVENGVMVPVIRNSQNKDIPQIAKEINRLSEKARSNQLNQEDISAGSITMTNFGMSGMHMGIPIIRHPEVAIIGIGSIHRKVVPLEDDTIAIRQMVYLTLTFDHRIIDGIYGANFLAQVRTNLEKSAP